MDPFSRVLPTLPLPVSSSNHSSVRGQVEIEMALIRADLGVLCQMKTPNTSKCFLFEAASFSPPLKPPFLPPVPPTLPLPPLAPWSIEAPCSRGFVGRLSGAMIVACGLISSTNMLDCGAQHVCWKDDSRDVSLNSTCWQAGPYFGVELAAVALGYGNGCALRLDTREAICWGYSQFGQMDVPQPKQM